MSKRSSDRQIAYPEVKVQGLDLVRVVGIVTSFGPYVVRYPGKIRFAETKGEMGT